MLGWYIIVGTIPVVVVGVLLRDVIENEFRNLWITGSVLVGLGIVLGIAEWVGKMNRPID